MKAFAQILYGSETCNIVEFGPFQMFYFSIKIMLFLVDLFCFTYNFNEIYLRGYKVIQLLDSDPGCLL